MDDTDAERGLVIMSALLNFVDYLNSQQLLIIPEKTRGKLVIEFLEDHSDKRHCFRQATDIAARLGVPLGRPNNPDESLKRIAEKILDGILNFDLTVPAVQEDVEAITKLLNENWDA